MMQKERGGMINLIIALGPACSPGEKALRRLQGLKWMEWPPEVRATARPTPKRNSWSQRLQASTLKTETNTKMNSKYSQLEFIHSRRHRRRRGPPRLTGPPLPPSCSKRGNTWEWRGVAGETANRKLSPKEYAVLEGRGHGSKSHPLRRQGESPWVFCSACVTDVRVVHVSLWACKTEWRLMSLAWLTTHWKAGGSTTWLLRDASFKAKHTNKIDIIYSMRTWRISEITIPRKCLYLNF